MKCRNCGEKLAKNAVTCPNCGANLTAKVKKPIFKKWWFWLIIVLLIIVIIPGGDTPEKVGSNDAPSVQAESTAPPVYTVGDTLEMKNVRVTLNSVTESTGANYVNPADGKIFVICEYTIENNTDSDLAVSSLMSFECYADDFTCPVSIGAMLASGKAQLDGTVAAGKKINGVVGYEVDPDYTELELRYNPKLVGTDFVFVYTSSSDLLSAPDAGSEIAPAEALYEDGNLNVTFLKAYEEPSISGVFYLQLLVENNSDSEVWVYLTDASVNGFSTMVMSGIPMKIASGNKSQQPFFISYQNLDTDNIDGVHEIQFKIVAQDTATSKNIVQSEILTISLD